MNIGAALLQRFQEEPGPILGLAGFLAWCGLGLLSVRISSAFEAALARRGRQMRPAVQVGFDLLLLPFILPMLLAGAVGKAGLWLVSTPAPDTMPQARSDGAPKPPFDKESDDETQE